MDSSQGEPVDYHGTNCVKQDLECAEKSFAEYGVKEEGFERGRKIGIEPVDTKRFVMSQVIWLRTCQLIARKKGQGVRTYSKRSAVWNPYRQIGKNSEETIGERRLKCKIMGNFMDGKEKVLIRGGADNIGREKER